MEASKAAAEFGAICLGLALTPGPNMIYLVSRSITQGARAGLLSLVGTGAASLVYLLLASTGLAALAAAVPTAYDALRLAGALYLGWLAWKALRPGGSPFEVRPIRREPPARLVAMGFLTNIVNPKTAVVYVSLLPQFIDGANGAYLPQSILLGLLQISISMTCNSFFVVAAGRAASVLERSPRLLVAQRWLMGGVLASLAVELALERTR